MKRKLLLTVVIVLLLYSRSFATFTFIMKHYQGLSGSQITVPVMVKDFINIISVSGTIQFDPTVLSFVSVQDYGLTGMSSSDFGLLHVSSGILTFAWIESALSGVNLADSAVIFSIKFNVSGTPGQSNPLTFTSTPTLIEVVDNAFVSIPYLLADGSVTVYTATSIQGTENNPSCNFNIIPNIFSGSTRLVLEVPEEKEATFSIYNLTGQMIHSFTEKLRTGFNDIKWTSTDVSGNILQTGVYFCVLRTENYSLTRKMIIVR